MKNHDCEFDHLYRAVIANNIDKLEVSRCDFHDMARTSIYAVDIRDACEDVTIGTMPPTFSATEANENSGVKGARC